MNNITHAIPITNAEINDDLIKYINYRKTCKYFLILELLFNTLFVLFFGSLYFFICFIMTIIGYNSVKYHNKFTNNIYYYWLLFTYFIKIISIIVYFNKDFNSNKELIYRIFLGCFIILIHSWVLHIFKKFKYYLDKLTLEEINYIRNANNTPEAVIIYN